MEPRIARLLLINGARLLGIGYTLQVAGFSFGGGAGRWLHLAGDVFLGASAIDLLLALLFFGRAMIAEIGQAVEERQAAVPPPAPWIPLPEVKTRVTVMPEGLHFHEEDGPWMVIEGVRMPGTLLRSCEKPDCSQQQVLRPHVHETAGRTYKPVGGMRVQSVLTEECYSPDCKQFSGKWYKPREIGRRPRP